MAVLQFAVATVTSAIKPIENKARVIVGGAKGNHAAKQWTWTQGTSSKQLARDLVRGTSRAGRRTKLEYRET
jgi:hypothetical protein